MSNVTQSTPSWKIELNSRIQKFAEIIKVDLAIVRNTLLELGVDSENESSLEILDDPTCLPIADLFTSFVDTGLAKKSLIRLGVKQLYGQTKEIETEHNDIASVVQAVVSANKPKSEMSDLELLTKYSPEEPEIIDILRKRSHGRYFIVFEGNQIDVSKSMQLLKIAKYQSTADRHSFNNKIYKLYRAGDFPVISFDESPFFENVILQDGYCPRSNTSWNNVSFDAKVLIRIYVKHVEKKELTQLEMKRLASLALDLEKLKNELNSAIPIYDYLKDTNKLPSLKVFSNSINKSSDTGF